MMLFRKSKYALTKLVITISSALLTVSCADMMKKPEPLTEAAACDQLQGIVDAHPDHFNKYKKNKRVVKNLHTWTATVAFPTAKNCQIFEWSSGINSYTCKWKADDGESGAKASYLEGARIIRKCLGSEWLSGNNPTSSGGEHTYFFRQNSATYVSIRYFKEHRSIMDNWYSVIYVGDKSNLKAKTQ